jgi:hypothetical protein
MIDRMILELHDVRGHGGENRVEWVRRENVLLREIGVAYELEAARG